MNGFKLFLRGIASVFFDANLIVMLLVAFGAWLFLVSHAHAGDVRTVKLNQTTVARILIAPGRSTVLSFPTKPTKVILGNQGLFAIEYVESDLAVAALSAHAHSDLFVYLDGRRFAFDLGTVPTGGDTIVLVRDAPAEVSDDTEKHTPVSRKKSVKRKEVRHE